MEIEEQEGYYRKPGNGLVAELRFFGAMTPENLNVDDRTIDRIIKSSVVIQMPEESIRRKTAGEEQISLLRKIGI